MSEDGVYQSSVPSFLFGDVEFEAARPDPILGGLRWLVVTLGRFVVQSKWSKIDLQEFRIRPEVRD